ncbi:glycoside hydrolase family 9 protein [uncultured Cytophaga sp.]|mgnify:CR=1 FL=1|uniref:glycoside hydrolase family 9 protein n=1 Tax=uncultured Cytophaga sp. TaxID=160238 RepID=UPI00260B2E85|nr:glycoside hydrolase family 9 protein [uncultured Cytophaga sp.]
MTRFISALLFFFIQQTFLQADIYPRYNHAGYPSKSNKSCIILSDESLNGKRWTIKNSSDLTVAEGIFSISTSAISEHTPKPFNYEIEFSSLKKIGIYAVNISAQKTFSIEIKNNPTDFIVAEMLHFLNKQRSGVPVPPANKIGHSGDSSCRVYEKRTNANTSWDSAKKERYVDMMGGWYDAGDYLKFTQTTAYTTYFLLRAYETYPTHATSVSDKKAIMDEALWGLSYLLKTMPNDSTFIIQVGNADDHKQGPRMPYEDKLNGLRNAYSDFSPTQMGLTSAALAFAAHLFEANPLLKIRSKPYRDKAIQIYQKAKRTNKNPAWVEEGWEKFYSDESGYDNMELASVELYKLTLDDYYLDQAKMFAQLAGPAYWSSWGNLNMIAHLNLYKYASQTVEPYLKSDLNNFNSIASKQGNIWRVPHAYTWATLYSFMSVASSSMIYKNVIDDASPYDRMSTDVYNYTLGQNNWGVSMIITDKIPGSVKNVFSHMHTLHPEISSTGAIAEGPGDKKTHDELMKYFNIPKNNSFESFNTNEVVFYDYNSDFQCMETTISGMADGIYFFTLFNAIHGK